MAEVGATKQVLAYAIKALMAKRPLAKITVGDVCQACGMNRKSFYYHFQDKYDLVAWIFRGELAAEAEGAVTIRDMMLALCRTMENNLPFYRSALKDRGQNSLQEYIAEELRPSIEAELAPHLPGIAYGESLPGLYVDTCCAWLVRWVQDGCRIPAEAFVELLQNAALTAGRLAASAETH